MNMSQNNHTTPASNYQCFWVSDTSEEACIIGLVAVSVSVVIIAVGVGMIIWHRSSQRKAKYATRRKATTYQSETDSFAAHETEPRPEGYDGTKARSDYQRSQAQPAGVRAQFQTRQKSRKSDQINRTASMQLPMRNGERGEEADNPWSKFEVSKATTSPSSSLDRLPEEPAATRERSNSDESAGSAGTTSTLRSFYSVGGTRSVRRARRPMRRSRNRKKKKRTKARAGARKQTAAATRQTAAATRQTATATRQTAAATRQPEQRPSDLSTGGGDHASRAAAAFPRQQTDKKKPGKPAKTDNPWSKFEVSKATTLPSSSLDRLPEEPAATRERSNSDESAGSAGTTSTLRSFYSVGGTRSVRRVRRPMRRSRNRKKKKRTKARAGARKQPQPRTQSRSASRPTTSTLPDISEQWTLPPITEAAENASSGNLTRVDTVLLAQQYPAPPSVPQ